MRENFIHSKVLELMEQMTIEEKLIQLASYFPNHVERLGIPNLQAGECLHGVAADEATSFPQAIALGSTWDPDLIERVATVIAKEARALGIHQCYTPMLGVTRDCRWGRTEESYGEDPYLVSRIGVAFIKGLQGTGNERFGPNRIIATAKHFVADGEPMSGTNGAAVEISERALHEVHLPPFKAAVEESLVYSVMPAHHSLNGVPCHSNEYILKDILRGEYGFEGFLVSDNGDIRMMHTRMKTAKSVNEAAIGALKAGVDSELAWMCPWGPNRSYGSELLKAIKNKEINEDIINAAVSNVLKAKLALGLFDNDEPIAVDDGFLKMLEGQSGDEHIHYADTKRSFGIKREDYKEVLYDDQHNKIALEAALKSIILLKNEGNLLPLNKKKLKKIAVIGPNSNAKVLGGYSTKNPRYVSTILDGIRSYVGKEIEVLYAEGCGPEDFLKTNIDEAVVKSKEADVVIVVLGGNELTCKENEDVDTLSLVGNQQELLEAVYATGTQVVLVLLHGRPNSIGWATAHIPAILEGWYLGQECGNAITKTLFGENNPGGKLPITVPRNVGQCPCFYNKIPSGREGKYYNSEAKPLYPFGYGLSYTQFELSSPIVSDLVMRKGERITVTVTVKNTGKYDGEEVVQLYIRQQYARVTRPSIELKDFQRVFVKAGETKDIVLALDDHKLAYRLNGSWVNEPGMFTVLTGSNSVALKTAEFEYIGEH